MSEDFKFNYTVRPLPEGEAVTHEEIEARMLKQLEELGGKDIRTLRNLVWTYIRMKRFEEARKHLDVLLTVMDNDEGRAHCLLEFGQLMEHKGDYAEAVTFYRLAVLMEPCNRREWYYINNNLGYSLNQLGKFSEAEKFLRAAIAINPRRPNGYKNLGLCLQGQGNLAGAAACFIDATKADAGDDRSVRHLAELIQAHPELTEGMPNLMDDLKHCVKAVEMARAGQPDWDEHWRKRREEQKG